MGLSSVQLNAKTVPVSLPRRLTSYVLSSAWVNLFCIYVSFVHWIHVFLYFFLFFHFLKKLQTHATHSHPSPSKLVTLRRWHQKRIHRCQGVEVRRVAVWHRAGLWDPQQGTFTRSCLLISMEPATELVEHLKSQTIFNYLNTRVFSTNTILFPSVSIPLVGGVLAL